MTTPRKCPRPLCFPLPETVPPAAVKADIVLSEMRMLWGALTMCSSSQVLQLQLVLGPFFSFSVLRNLSSPFLTARHLAPSSGHFPCFVLGTLKQGLGITFLATPKSNCPALATVVPTEPPLPAGFLFSVALCPRLLLFSLPLQHQHRIMKHSSFL